MYWVSDKYGKNSHSDAWLGVMHLLAEGSGYRVPWGRSRWRYTYANTRRGWRVAGGTVKHCLGLGRSGRRWNCRGMAAGLL